MRFRRARALGSRPSVSVVIPCYNYGRYLPAAVSSVLQDEGVQVDILIVDDASTDGSAEIAHSLATMYPEVDVLVHEENRGHIATYNDGLARARGEYVVLLSADDQLTPGSLSRATALLEAHPEVAWVYGAVCEFDQDLPVVSTRTVGWGLWTGDEWLRRVAASGRNLTVSPEIVVRRRVLEDAGGFDQSHPHAADMLLCMQMAARGHVGRILGAPQAYYRVHGVNMHSTQYASLVQDYQAVRDVFRAFFVERLESSRQPDGLHERARRAMAHEAVRQANVVVHDSADPASAAEATALMHFARETDPAVVGTRSWRSCSARLAGRDRRRRSSLARRAHALRWSLRSRRSRWLGT